MVIIDSTDAAYATLGHMKLMIWIGITVGGLLGSWLGALLDGNNYLGTWSILLGGVGSLAGLWASYKVGKTYFE